MFYVFRLHFVRHFNSHAHVERDLCEVFRHSQFFISTHTLTWSVTDKRQANRQTTDISTHTLTWSVTNMWHLYDGYWNFNSHAHVERDPITSRLYWFARSISTHTLTWSVTYKMTPRDGVEVNFNSHAHVERDVWHFYFMGAAL